MATAAEVSAWSREVRRLENQIEHRRGSLAKLEATIKGMEEARDELIEKIVGHAEGGGDE